MTGARWAWAVVAATCAARLLSAVSGYDIVADVDPTQAGRPPAPGHWLGTDALGRDVAWRLVRATDAFVLPALGAAGVGLTLGGGLGTAAGWVGGGVERGLAAVAGLPATAPRFVLVLLLATIFEPSATVLALACGVSFVPVVTAEVRTRVAQARGRSFVTASLLHGLSVPQVLGHHILWTGCRHVLARLALQAAAFYLVVETSLAYLGDLGVQEPTPSWGNMIAGGLVDSRLHWVARLAPAVVLWLVLMAVGQLDRDLARAEGTP